MNKYTKIFSGIVLAVIFCFFSWFLSNDIFSGEDIPALSDWLTEGGKFNLDGIITAIMTHIFGRDLPLLLHINPHAFSMTAGAWIRAFNTVLLCYIISVFMFNGRTKSKNFPIVLLFSALYFCYACSNVEFDWFNPNNLPIYDSNGTFILLTEYSEHFGQLVNLILGLGFLYFAISHFTQNKKPNEKHLKVITIFAFLTAMSSLFVNVVCGIVLIFISIYLGLINFNKKEEIKNNAKIIIFPLIGYLLGSCVFAFYPGYTKFFSFGVNYISYAKILFKNYIITNSLEFALILILAAILYFLAEKKSTYIKRTVFAVFASLFGAITYFLLFSSLNKYIGFFLTESQVLLRLLLVSMILLLFGACMREHCSEPKEQKLLSVCFILVWGAFLLIQTPFIFSTMKIWRNMNEETKNTMYCLEKMYRFYSLKGKTALLPNDSLFKLFKISVFLDDQNVDVDESISNKTFFKHTSFTDGYYKTFYKNAKIVPYKFIDSQKALKIFFEEGGMIDAKEMKNLDFQNLYNDKFVINRAIEKSKYEN